MNIIYTVLFAFALGFLNRQRAVAVALYLAGGAFVFAFQSVNLMIEWVGGSESAFGGPYPGHEASKVVGYGVFNVVITVVGIGLVAAGARVREKRAEPGMAPDASHRAASSKTAATSPQLSQQANPPTQKEDIVIKHT